MNGVLSSILSWDFLSAGIRVTTPILLAALGALVAELAGTPNIALEGTMLFSAFVGVIISGFTQNIWLSIIGALITGWVMSSILAYFSLKLKTDIIMAAIALNIFASGGTVYALYLLTGDKGSSASVKSLVLPNIDIPIIKDIPILGNILSGHHVLTYVAVLMIFLVQYMLYKTPLGLRIRSVGESPDAARSVGISVFKTQYTALVISGLLASLAGVFLSMGYVSWFARDMTAGRGFIALAAQALGGTSAYGVALGSLLFGFSEALSFSLQFLNIPYEVTQSMPFLITVGALAFYAWNKVRESKEKIF
ncbi:ABC transporter permease [Marinitoga sp. 1135]|uniref:Putative ABC-type transport system, permease component n=1 Tax=Marinitoga piezophila (strain DSM 14283 / JCM 11233 / KA3) TaxID=443254 RepID=H2J453_MARPK|nr:MULTISPECIES: ABC transporter permease [Marinitoga]AEX85868.1 putative ABC-type transport system, permease component [Marinitoga piezophila KA3]APT76304.1 ABC transporter permease [Marinitoga sp. 1137]NUU96070.1 ABC transporter permease [Marinitoga sp. 1135]NUU97981.1 ABC transporter permease [Marinitoga sp. 1138]